jgi:hypothetical protein
MQKPNIGDTIWIQDIDRTHLRWYEAKVLEIREDPPIMPFTSTLQTVRSPHEPPSFIVQFETVDGKHSGWTRDFRTTLPGPVA